MELDERIFTLQQADGEFMQLFSQFSAKYDLSFAERTDILSRTIARDAQYNMRKKRKHG